MKKHVNTVVAVLLVLGIVAAAVALYAGGIVPRLFGPRLIAQDSHGRVWLIVDHTLFLTDEEGNPLIRRELSGIDGGMPVNGLARLPDKDGQARMLVAVIGQPAWWVMQDGEIVERVVPEDTGAALGEAFHVMTRPDGAIALATGGDHRVLRFSPTGKRLAVSQAGLFRFANGGEYVADDAGPGQWLVPDTNHHALRFLHAGSLAQLRHIPLAGGWAAMARVSRNPGQYTVALMGAGMDKGRVVDLDAQGNVQFSFALPEDARPRGLTWLGDRLLVADAEHFAFHAYARNGNPLGAWGGPALKAHLARAGDYAHDWRLALRLSQILGGLCLFAALAIYFASKRWLTFGQAPETPIDLSRLATPRMDAREQARWTLRLTWPSLLLAAIVLAVPQPGHLSGLLGNTAADVSASALTGLPVSALAALIWLCLCLAAALLLVSLQWRVSRRALRDPRFEGLFSARAVAWLAHSHDVGNALMPGESVREVLFAGRSLAWVLTNRRFLEFDRGLSERTHVRALPRGLTRATLARIRWLPGHGALRIEAPGYTRQAVVASPVTAARLAALLAQGVSGDAWAPLPETHLPHLTPGPGPALCVLLSLLWPGLAQWAQNRFRPALGFMSLALAFYLFTVGPILLGLYGHHYDVSRASQFSGIIGLASIIGFALWDALAYTRRHHAPGLRP